MNELTKQLIENAGITLDQKDFSYYWVESKEDIEKLVVMIVKECAGVAGCNAHVSGFALGDLIEEHFGVK